jgi:hypothetical protein
MNCCNEYGHCTGGHNCPTRATPLVDASRKALAVLSLTGADPALQDELVGAMSESDRRIAELTARGDDLWEALKQTRRALWEELIDDDLRPFSEVCADARNHHAIQAADAAIAKHQPTAAPAANTP